MGTELEETDSERLWDAAPVPKTVATPKPPPPEPVRAKRPAPPYTFVPVPHWLYRKRWMNSYDRDVWICLRRSARVIGLKYHGVEVKVDQHYIARSIGASLSTVYRSLIRLESHRLIRVIRVGLNQSNKYRLIDPEQKIRRNQAGPVCETNQAYGNSRLDRSLRPA